MLEKSNCPAAGTNTTMKCRGDLEIGAGITAINCGCDVMRPHPSLCGCRTSGLHTKAVNASAAPGISFTNPAMSLVVESMAQ